MLVAKRDPFELGAHVRPVPHAGAAPSSSRFIRTLNILQMLGALIAVPAGIGSAYTMYKTHYSPEASCQTLRTNIVALLDKGVDASARRVLVRRDIETFEQTCGTVDPDATAAFKALLAAEKTPQQPQPSQTVVRKIETAPVAKAEPAPVAKAEPAPVPKAKPAAARASTVATAPVQHEAPESDAAWVAAVRGALVNHKPEAAPAAAAAPAAPTSLAPPPRMLGELHAPQVLPSAPLPPPPLAAPALPPPEAVATVSLPQVDPDHPVPPAAIPEAAPPARQHSRLGEWVAEIPFVGKSIADRVTR